MPETIPPHPLRRWVAHARPPTVVSFLFFPAAPLARLLVLALGIALAAPIATSAEPPTAEALESRASFLCSLLRFTEWPTEDASRARGPLVIGVLGRDPLIRVLRRQARELQVRGRSLRVVQFPSLADVRACHMLYVAPSAAYGEEPLLAATSNSPVLTVADSAGFAQRGGVIALVEEDERLSIEINVDAARRAQLRVSSRLLKLARLVHEPGSANG